MEPTGMDESPTNANSPTELDVTVPYSFTMEPEAPPRLSIPNFNSEDMAQLGWREPHLEAIRCTINTTLSETMPDIQESLRNELQAAVHREVITAPRPPFDMNGFFEHLDHHPRALAMIRHIVAPLPVAPASTELHALLDRAPTGMAAYLLFLKEAKDLKLSLVDRAALFSKTLSLVEQAHRRTNLSELQVYHAQLTAAYTDPVALACLNEPSVTHDHRSVTAVEVLTWIKAYKDARPRSKAPKNAGGGHSGRRPRPRRTGAPLAKPADKQKTGTSSVKKPTAGK